jgi:hypothetical protein
LHNGRILHFTPEESRRFKEALAIHEEVIRIWGMCKSLGLRA